MRGVCVPDGVAGKDQLLPLSVYQGRQTSQPARKISKLSRYLGIELALLVRL
jgi:hypothetical protein